MCLLRLDGPALAVALVLALAPAPVAVAGVETLPGPEPSCGAADLTDEAPVPIAGGERVCASLALGVGEFLLLEVDQLGADVELRLEGPDSPEAVEADSPNDATGREELAAIAETAGEHRFEIEAGSAGAYRARLTRRPATAADRARVEADRRWRVARERFAAGAPAEALTGFREAAAAFRELGLGRREADALTGLYRAHAALGERELEALLAERAGDLYGGDREPLQAAAALLHAGRLHLDLGDPGRAVPPLERAIPLYEAAGWRRGVALVLGRLGLADLESGRLQAALERTQRGLELARESGDENAEAQLDCDLGLVLLALHRSGEALAAGERARAVYLRTGPPEGLAVALQRIAQAALQLGESERAEASLGSAIALVTEPAGRAVVLVALGDARRRRGDFEGAQKMLTEGLELARKARDRRTEGLLLIELGHLRTLAGDPEAGLALHDRAAALLAEVGDRRGRASAEARGAQALAALGRPEEAWRRLSAALEAVEGLRSETERRDFRASYFAFRQDYYEIGLDLLTALHGREPSAGHDRAAFHLNERRLARELVDDLAVEPAAPVPPPDLLAEERRLESELAALASRPGGAGGAPAGEIDDLLAGLHTARGRLREAGLEGGRPPAPGAVTAAEVQAELLDPETALLIFALGEERSRLWCLTAGSFESFLLPGRAEIEQLADDFAGLAARRSPLAESGRQRHGQRLTELLLAPAAGRIAGRRLAIVADGSLQRLPFAALPAPGDPARFLIEKHELVLLPSATALAALRRAPAPAPAARGRVAAFADPVYSVTDPRVGGMAQTAAPGVVSGVAALGPTRGAGDAEVLRGPAPEPATPSTDDLTRSARDLGADPFERLPYSLAEAERILALAPAPGNVLAAGFEADRETLIEGDAAEYAVLHFATHGLVHPDRPELSGLVLSLVDRDGRPRNGFLRSFEISRLRLAADLVVLSACESGIGTDLRGEGMASLARSFFHAGARRVIATLWRVSDEKTTTLMERFYRVYLAEGRPPAAALRAAQLAAMGERATREPYYWAGFVLQGDWRGEGR